VVEDSLDLSGHEPQRARSPGPEWKAFERFPIDAAQKDAVSADSRGFWQLDDAPDEPVP
jgi:hypothetical protein